MNTNNEITSKIGSSTVVSARGFLRWLTVSVFVGAVLLGTARRASAATITVANNSDAGAGSLRAAIASAAPGDTINFDPIAFATPQTITLSTAQLAITQPVTITGPAAALTIDGGAKYRIFYVAVAANPVTISGLTLTNGKVNGDGGAILTAGNLTLQNVALTNNQGSGYGGAIYPTGTLLLNHCTISGNTAIDGGGIANGVGTLTVQNSTFSGNMATNYGGGLYTRSPATIQNTTFSGNTAATDGGAIFNITGALTLTNSTISGNSSAHSGGGIYSRYHPGYTGTNNIQNCTIANNSAGVGYTGGGIAVGAGATVELTSTLVAKNTHSPLTPVPDDIAGPIVNTSSNNLVGVSTGLAGIAQNSKGNIIGTAATPIDPQIGPLQNNGGPTATHALSPTSPAIDAGSNPNLLVTDQRGGGYLRTLGFATDIGAFEAPATAPSLIVTNTNDSGPNSLRNAIRTSNATAGINTVQFQAGLSGSIGLVSEISITNSVNIPGPGAATLAVDGGASSRIFYVSNAANPVTISGLTLTNGNDATTGGGAILNEGTLTLQNVSITNNNSGSGGGISNDTGAMLSADTCVFSGNTTSGWGGAMYNRGTAQLNLCTISGNNANGGGGGGICQNGNGILTIQNSTLSGNTASGFSGGGLYSRGNATIQNTAIIGNTTLYAGGGIYTKGTLILTNSTISGNLAKHSGGGIYSLYKSALYKGTSTVKNSTIAYNTADSGSTNAGTGGGVYVKGGALVTLTSTLVAKNTHNVTTPVADDIDDSRTNIVSTSSNNLVDVNTNLTGIKQNTNGNIIGTAATPIDPQIGPLQNNGGPTATHALSPTSPAIDAGSNPNLLITDQRGAGFARNLGFATDIGAFEAPATAPSLIVTNTNDSGPNSLRNAIRSSNANPGANTVQFQAGLSGSIGLLSGISVTNAVNIPGPGAATLAVDGGNNTYLFNIASSASAVTISGLTLSNGKAPGRGGAIFSQSPNLTVSNAVITGNTAVQSGGGINLYRAGGLTLQNSTVSSNTANNGGGVYCGYGTAVIDNSTLTKNTAVYNGGGIYLRTNGTLKIQNNSALTFNTATNQTGGALFSDGKATLDNSTVSNNTSAGNGGGIVNNGGTLTIQNAAVVSNNTAGNANRGGGIRNTGTLKIDKSTISGNSAGNGGGVDGGNSQTITNSVITGNTAAKTGGGINNNVGGTLLIDSSTISNNSATAGNGNGGALYDRGVQTTIKNSTVSGNMGGPLGNGGAIFIYSNNGLIQNSTLSGNHSAHNGGAIANYRNLTIVNSTLSGNSAAFSGGAISNVYVATAPNLTVQNCTIANNQANFPAGSGGTGGGIRNTQTASLVSTIVSGNTAFAKNDLDGNFTAFYSLIKDPTGATLLGASANNITSQDPLLLPLGPNGGPTLTMAIPANSPAHDAGSNPTHALFDQRGSPFSRTLGAGPDIGAFEVQNEPLSLIVTNLNDSGTGSLRRAVNVGNDTPGPDTVQFLAGLTGTILLTSGQINITDAITIPGPGAGILSVDGNNASRIFNIPNNINGAQNISISGLTLQHGNSIDGGAIVNLNQNLTVSNATLSGNTASGPGGALEQTGGNLSLINATVSGNTSTFARGGGLALYSVTAAIQNSTLSGNTAASKGGGIYQHAGNLTISQNSMITGVNTGNDGGGIAMVAGAVLTLDNSTVSNNTAGYGGGVYLDGNNNNYLKIQNNAVISGNSASTGSGGGIYSGKYSKVTLKNSTVSKNTAQYNGGGIQSYRGTLTLDTAVLSGNTATAGNGGAIACDGYFGVTFITNSVFSGDSAPKGYGGSIAQSGYRSLFTLKNSTISGESAKSGGAIYQGKGANFASLVVLNSTLNGNQATAYNGGAIDVSYGYLKVQNSTLNANSAAAGFGGGIYDSSPKVNPGNQTIQSTIVSGNTASASNDIFGTFTADHNLVKDPTGATLLGASNITLQDPLLGPLQINGGVVPTQALMTGSPAKDAGSNPANLGFDERGPGFPRFSGLAVDIGAFETTDAPKTFIVTNLNDSGPNSLRDAITQSNAFGGPNTVQFQSGLTGSIVLTSGQIPVTNSVTIPGPGAATLSVDGNNASGILFITGPSATDVSVSDLTLTHGKNNNAGGAIGSSGNYSTNLSINNAVLSGNTAVGRGGAIYNYGSLTIQNSTVSKNNSGDEGGGIYSSGPTNVQNTVVSGNNATDSGGGIDAHGSLTLLQSTVSNNVSASGGGGLYAGARYATDTISIQNSTISGNLASRNGGGVLAYNFYNRQQPNISSSLTIQNSTITNNVASYSGNGGGGSGGGVYVGGNNGLITVQNTVVSNNKSTGTGGGMSLNKPGSQSNIDSSTLANNTSFFYNKYSTLGGGGLQLYKGTLSVSNSTISGNNTNNQGGGINLFKTAFTLENSTVSENIASDSVGGGGVFCSLYSSMTASNCTLVGNVAVHGYGGGINVSYGKRGGRPSLRNSHNSPILRKGPPRNGSVTLQSTIVAGNRAATNPDVNGTFPLDFSLVQTPGNATLTNITPGSNLLNQTPLLGPLQNNGGPTLTHAILAASPGIGKGSNPNNQAFDQRGAGFPRVSAGSAAPDIGAVENEAPIANAGGPYTINEGAGLTLDGSKSSDPEGDPLTYSWDINGDGTFGDATGVNPTLTPAQLLLLGIGAQPGTFNVKVQVSDGVHTVTSAAVLLTVLDVAPAVAITGAPASSPEGTAISLTPTVTDLSAAVTAAGFTYAWNVTKNGAAFASGSTQNFTFTPDDNAAYVVGLSVTDEFGLTGTDSKNIAVTNVAPVTAINAAPANSSAGTLINLTSTVTDVSTVDTTVGFTYAWSVTKNGAAFASGTTQNYSFTPDTAGTYVVSLTATDKDGGSSSASSTINVGPSAAPNPITISSAPSAAPNPVVAGQTVVFSVGATDSAGATLTYTWDFGDGTTGTGSTPSHVYLLPGTYIATVTVTDSLGNTSSATVSVEVDAPLFLPDVKLSIGLRFNHPHHDQITLSGTVLVAQGVDLNGKTFTIDIGGILKVFNVVGHNKASDGLSSDTLRLARTSLASRTVRFALRLTKGDFAAAMAKLGLINATIVGGTTPVTVPVTVTVNNVIFSKNQPLKYKGILNKMGSTKQVPK